ncbi:S1C family serine protease [Pleionea sediminis]|uniref:S1C family serine protease n=1 Tax=Pleionea sediminis TaxID=2569479 RepID=UPI0011871402|nr:serine protease [Pleionea sediminis]
MKRFTFGFWLLLLWCNMAQAVDDAQQLFQNYKQHLYQLRTIDIASGSKSSIGSAFAIDSDGTLATNYHVVSQFILHPDKYQLEALAFDKQSLPVKVINIDVINDLALVKIDVESPQEFFLLAESEPPKGQQIFSLGNPRDLGMTVVPGTFNGQTEHTYYGRILFSGSINPGMSGGPVISREGKVIGVNVATSGNQISFLVPLSKLKKLVGSQGNSDESLSTQAYSQLKDNQSTLMSQLLDGKWEPLTLGEAQVFGELTDFVSCWGESQNNQTETYTEVYRRCKNSEYIYIAPDFYTGIIELEFFWYETEKLTNWQFYKMLNDSFGSAGAGNIAGEDHVTEYSCAHNFIESANSNKINKTVYCVRDYKQFPGLHDVLFLATSMNLDKKALVSHFTLSGVEQSYAQRFLKRFLEQIQ